MVLTEDTDPRLSDIEDIISLEEADLENRLGHAYTIRRADTEDLDFPQMFDWFFGAPIHLRHRKLQPIDAAEGDFVGVWLPNGEYEDWTAHQNTRWKINTNMGIFYVLGYVWWSTRENRVRLKYRYGEEDNPIPLWLKRCSILKSAIKLIETSLTMSRVSTVGEGIKHADLLHRWDEEVEKHILNNSEWVSVPYGS